MSALTKTIAAVLATGSILAPALVAAGCGDSTPASATDGTKTLPPLTTKTVTTTGSRSITSMCNKYVCCAVDSRGNLYACTDRNPPQRKRR